MSPDLTLERLQAASEVSRELVFVASPQALRWLRHIGLSVGDIWMNMRIVEQQEIPREGGRRGVSGKG